MVEILDKNETIQLHRIKTGKDQRKNRWGIGCQCCGRKFSKGQNRIRWRLMTPFKKSNHSWYGWSGMFWTTHCEPCFKFTARAWEIQLSKVVKIAKA